MTIVQKFNKRCLDRKIVKMSPEEFSGPKSGYTVYQYGEVIGHVFQQHSKYWEVKLIENKPKSCGFSSFSEASWYLEQTSPTNQLKEAGKQCLKAIQKNLQKAHFKDEVVLFKAYKSMKSALGAF